MFLTFPSQNCDNEFGFLLKNAVTYQSQNYAFVADGKIAFSNVSHFCHKIIPFWQKCIIMF